jgi:hypothetical protein
MPKLITSQNVLKAQDDTVAFRIRFLVKADLAVNHRHNAIAELNGKSATAKRQGTAGRTFS